MGKLFTAVGLIIMVCALAYAGESFEKKLNDGTTLFGEVVSLQGGVYEIKTNTVGTVEVNEKKVLSISKPAPAGAMAPAADNTAENSAVEPQKVEGGIDAIKRAMQGNSQTMDSIASLQDDPDFQEILNDPEIMAAVNSNDIEALSNNPKFLKLLDNSAVRDIGGDLQQ